MDALAAAIQVKSMMVEMFSAECDDAPAARDWYERNIEVWDAASLTTHAPKGVTRAQAAISLEGSPDWERGRDCWGVDISVARR